MQVRALKNKNGMTFIEVLAAIVIMSIVLLALLQTSLVAYQENIRNILRDEAMMVAEARMNELRSEAFKNLLATDPTGTTESNITRNIRGTFTAAYKPTRIVTDLDQNSKYVVMVVKWNWKGKDYSHGVTSVISRK